MGHYACDMRPEWFEKEIPEPKTEPKTEVKPKKSRTKYVVFSNTVKPARDGVYQRQMTIAGKPRWVWAKFYNGNWYCGTMNFCAAQFMDMYSFVPHGINPLGNSTFNWRGLARKPEV